MKMLSIFDVTVDLSQAVFFSSWWGLEEILLGMEEGQGKTDGGSLWYCSQIIGNSPSPCIHSAPTFPLMNFRSRHKASAFHQGIM